MFESQPIGISRRALLKNAGCGFGYLAFAGLASQAAAAEQNPLSAKSPHFPARAKRVIFMFMHGGPSQVDTFDFKPTLAKYASQPAPFVKSVTDGSRGEKASRCFAQLPGNSPSTAKAVAGSPNCFRTSPGMWTTCA